MDGVERFCSRMALTVPVLPFTVLVVDPPWWMVTLMAACALLVLCMAWRVHRAPAPAMRSLPPGHERGHRDRPDIRSVGNGH